MLNDDSTQFESCLNQQHVDSDIIKSYADAYRSHSANVLQIEHFFNEALIENASQYLIEDAQYGEIFGLYSRQNHVCSKSEWEDAPETDRFFYYEMANSTRPDARLSLSLIHFLKLRKCLSSNAFKSYLEQLTGRTLGEIVTPRIHRMNHKHYLKSHDDRTSKRAVAFILYLTPDWQTSDGGTLCLKCKDSSQYSFDATYNSLIIFDVNSHQKHHISNIQPKAANGKKHFRLCISGWFKEPEE